MKKVLSALLAAAMILSLAACSGGTTTSSSSSSTASSDSSTESSTVSSESEATEDDPILTGEKPELKILSMYQAYNYEEQPTWKIDEELTGYKTKWYALPADNADQKLLLEISSGADYDILLRVSPSQYAQLSKQNALIDLSGMLTPEQVQSVEAEANEWIWKNVPVEVSYPDPEALKTIPYRSKKELTGDVRLVEAGGDCCACCGTHLARTGEVGLIKIISAQHYKTGMRLAVACGRRAYDAVAAICADAEAAGRVLSAPAGSLTPSVENRQNGEAVLKQRIAALQNALADAYVQAAAPDRPAVLWAEGADGDGLRRIAMAVCAGTNQVACALAPGGQGLSYALAAPDGTDARALGRALNEAFAGRGGGKPAFCQGSLAQPGLTPDVVREKLSTLL